VYSSYCMYIMSEPANVKLQLILTVYNNLSASVVPQFDFFCMSTVISYIFQRYLLWTLRTCDYLSFSLFYLIAIRASH